MWDYRSGAIGPQTGKTLQIREILIERFARLDKQTFTPLSRRR
jgi:hypothetical protein